MNKNLIKQTTFYHIKDKRFYDVDGFYGDPEAALEAGCEYMTDEFLYAIRINENGKIKIYALKTKRTTAWKDDEYFWDYYVTREEATKILNNKIKKIKK